MGSADKQGFQVKIGPMEYLLLEFDSGGKPVSAHKYGLGFDPKVTPIDLKDIVPATVTTLDDGSYVVRAGPRVIQVEPERVNFKLFGIPVSTMSHLRLLHGDRT